jgi:hypothetical protein
MAARESGHYASEEDRRQTALSRLGYGQSSTRLSKQLHRHSRSWAYQLIDRGLDGLLEKLLGSRGPKCDGKLGNCRLDLHVSALQLYLPVQHGPKERDGAGSTVQVRLNVLASHLVVL